MKALFALKLKHKHTAAVETVTVEAQLAEHDTELMNFVTFLAERLHGFRTTHWTLEDVGHVIEAPPGFFTNAQAKDVGGPKGGSDAPQVS